MRPAVPAFAPKVEATHVELPRFTVVSNVDAKPYRDVGHIKENLIRSVTAEVLWHETSMRLVEQGVDLVVEFGASPVLGPMIKRVPGVPEVASVSDRSRGRESCAAGWERPPRIG